MKKRLPFSETAPQDDAPLTPAEEEAIMDAQIEKMLDYADDFAFCMEKMIMSGDITTKEIKEKMDVIFPNLTNHAQMYYQILLQGPAYDEYEEEDKKEALECAWAKKLPAVILMQYGADITNIGARSFTQAIGSDEAAAKFFKSLVYINSILHKSFIDACNRDKEKPLLGFLVKEEDLPWDRISDVVGYARGTQDFFDGNKGIDITSVVPFKTWFTEGLVATPLEFYKKYDEMHYC